MESKALLELLSNSLQLSLLLEKYNHAFSLSADLGYGIRNFAFLASNYVPSLKKQDAQHSASETTIDFFMYRMLQALSSSAKLKMLPSRQLYWLIRESVQEREVGLGLVEN